MILSLINLADITQIRMAVIRKLQNFLRRSHILIASYRIQRREGNMTVLALRCFSSCHHQFIMIFCSIRFILTILEKIRHCFQLPSSCFIYCGGFLCGFTHFSILSILFCNQCIQALDASGMDMEIDLSNLGTVNTMFAALFR